MLIRREIYESIGGLDSKYELLQDWDLWFRALERGDYYYHPEAFCHWFSHPYGSNLSELFAREHLKFLHALSEAGSGSLERSASFQLAKLRTWLPDTDPAALALGLPEEAYVRGLRPVDSASAPGVLKSCGREIGVRMQALRLIGYFRR